MKVLVCGGRHYGHMQLPGGKWAPDQLERNILTDYLNVLHMGCSITHIIHGKAPGADSLADEWALKYGIQRVQMPADWDALGKKAGPIRNRRMLELMPDVVVAFPGGAGTLSMCELAETAGVDVHRIAIKSEYTFADHRLAKKEASPC
jgi:hypothetical protein